MSQQTPQDVDVFPDGGDDVDLLPDDTPQAAWIPGAETMNHNGDPALADRVYFAEPPEAIGEVITAYSTLAGGKRPMRPMSRMFLTAFCGTAVAAGLYVAGIDVVFQVLAGLLAAGLAWYFTRFSHKVSYVGKLGVARLTCTGRTDRITNTELFLFENAAELRTWQTRHYHNGVYTGTQYRYSWTNERGGKAFTLSGSYHGEKKPPKPKDPFHFATSTETAWSIYLFDRASAELGSNGSIVFRLGGQDWVALGPGFVDMSRKGEVERWTIEEIGGIQIHDGSVKIKRVDAKEGWFSSKGVFAFPYNSMANARLFLIAQSRLLPVPVY